MIKLDFEKAFDNLDWVFLLNSLKAKGFSPRWFRWVEMCLTSSYAVVLINGKAGNPFKVHKGVKQGCPFSPLLFIMVVDVLDAIIRRSTEACLLNGHRTERRMAGGESPFCGWCCSSARQHKHRLYFWRRFRFALKRPRVLRSTWARAHCTTLALRPKETKDWSSCCNVGRDPYPLLIWDYQFIPRNCPRCTRKSWFRRSRGDWAPGSAGSSQWQAEWSYLMRCFRPFPPMFSPSSCRFGSWRK